VRLSKGGLPHVCTSANPKKITTDTGSFEKGLQQKAQNSKKLVLGHVNLSKYPCSGFFFKLSGKAVRLSKGGLPHVCTSTNPKKNNRRHRFIRKGPTTEGPKLKKVGFGPCKVA